MAENKIKVTNKKQFQLMVGILDENPSVAKGLKFAESAHNGRQLFTDVWDEITATLNSMGPPSREAVGWQKVWSDLKLKVKKKLQHNRTEVNATGGGPNRLAVFSAYEETVVNLLSLNRTTDHEGPSFGLSSRPSPRTNINIQPDSSDGEVEDEMEEDLLEPAVGTPVTPIRHSRTPLTRGRRTPKKYRQNLLELQTDYLRELVENSQESLKIQQESLQLQREKFEYKKEYMERSEKMKESKLQFQLQMLEYRKMKLELQRSSSNL